MAEQHARQSLYKSTTAVLQQAIVGNPTNSVVIGALSSPHEYAAIDHEEIRARSLATGLREEPSSVFSYPARNFGYIGLVPPNNVFLALMPDRPSMHAFTQGAQQVAEFYHFATFEPVWGPDPLAHADNEPPIDVFERVLAGCAADVAAQIRAHYPTAAHFALLQHANTPEGEEFQRNLLEQGIDTHAIYGEKIYNYPNFGDRSGFSSFTETYGLPAPLAVVAYSYDEMMSAYTAVAQTTNNPLVYAKLAASGGGYGVHMVESLRDVQNTYDLWNGFGMFGPIYEGGQVIPVEMQGTIPGIVDILSFQYTHGFITTPQRRDARNANGPAFTRQFIHGGTDWVGNGYGVELNIPVEHRKDAERVIAEFEARFMDAAEEEMGPAWRQATGGVDFALVDLEYIIEAQGIKAAKILMRDMWDQVYDETAGTLTSRFAPVIIEHNGLRESDAKPPALLAESLGLVEQGIPFAATKIQGVNADLPQVWDFLVSHGLNYDPATGQEGIVPVAWINDNEYGIHYGNVIVVAHDPEHLLQLRQRIIEEMQQAGLVTTSAVL